MRKKVDVVRKTPGKLRTSTFILLAFIATFNIFTAQAFAAQTSLAWDAPANADGTPTTGLSGYRIYLGTAPGGYTQNIDAGNQTSYTIGNLAEGTTYYFAVTAYDTAGSESGFSNEVSRSFQTPPPPAPVTYTITATAGSGGAITPSGNFPVNRGTNGSSTISTITVGQGDTLSLAITPNAGYKIADVKVDGVSKGKIASYTFSNVTAAHAILASFAASTPSTSSTKGDVDGDSQISLVDVLTVLRSVVNSAPLTPEQKTRADVSPLDASGRPSGDGVITLNDALAILRKVAGGTTW